MVGAIAAGCPLVLKPSEATPNASALMAKLIPKYLDPAAYAVVNGGPAETSVLLEFRWDHIFFTGGSKVGQIVATAAAKHITPISLELGGKSPVIIDSDCDVDLAAKRVLYGKLQNAGQVRPFSINLIRCIKLTYVHLGLYCSGLYPPSSIYRSCFQKVTLKMVQ